MTDNEATLTKAILKNWSSNGKAPRHIVAIQVHNAAGFSYSRRLDAVVFDTWPSSGLLMHGLEIKCSVADLRQELQNQKKFEDFKPHLNLFSIVAPRGMVDLAILPPKWGLYVPTEKGSLKTRRKPLPLHEESTRTIGRSFAAAFTRALLVRSMSSEFAEEEYKRGIADGEEDSKWKIEGLERNVQSTTEIMEGFQEKSGIRLESYDYGEIGEAVDVIMNGGLDRRFKYITSIRNMGERLIKMADDFDNLKNAFDGSDE